MPWKSENGQDFKLCPRCNKWKNAIDFNKNKNCRDGLWNYCKLCKREMDKAYHDKNKEHRNKKNNIYYHENKDEITAKRKESRKLPENKKKFKAYRKNNSEKVKLWKQNYYQKNKTEINRKWAAKRRNNLDLRLANNLRARLNKAIKGNHKTSSTVNLLGCSLQEFKNYFENMFQPGMSWDNYGSEWHIDHIKPCISFDLKTEEGQRECFNYLNLQPLWKIDNLKKNKY